MVKNQPEQFLSFNDISHLIGHKSRTTIWRWTRDGHFPKPYRIGPNSRAWKRSEVMAWIDQQKAVSEGYGR